MFKFFLPIGVAVVALLGLGYFIYSDVAPVSEGETASSTTSTISSSTEFGEITAVVTGKGSESAQIEITKVPANAPKAPSLDRPYTPPSHLPSSIQIDMQKNYSEMVSRIREDAYDANAWLELGTYRSNAGDYKGAEEAWLFVAIIAPAQHLAFANLGNLYEFHLKDYAKAEANYLKTLSLKPNYLPAYRSLFDLYTYRYQQVSAKAEGILLEGIAKNPGEPDLLVMLAQYYRDAGKKEQAKQRFLEARAAAVKAENTALVKSIDEEIAAL